MGRRKSSILAGYLPLSKQVMLEEMSERLSPVVHFNSAECLALLKIYQRIIETELMDRLKFRSILYCCFGITDGFMLDRIYRMADRNDTGFIDHAEWIIILSVLLRGTLDELIEFCYNVYDINGDRSLSTEELSMMLQNSFKPRGDLDEGDAREFVSDMVQLTLKKLDVDMDGQITFGDYRSAVMADPLLLQCCGTCLPSPKSIKSFQYLFAVDYSNFHSDWTTTPAKQVSKPSGKSRKSSNTSIFT